MLTARSASAGMPGVPKYDAFGREIGEDTLAGLGGTPRPSEEPADEGWRDAAGIPQPREVPEAPEVDRPVITIGDPPPQAAPRIPGAPRRRRRPRGFGCLIGLVFLAIVFGGPIAGMVTLVDDARDVFDDVTEQIDGIDPPDVAVDEPEPVGITGPSMLAPARFAQVLDLLQGRGTIRVTRFTIWPERLGTDLIEGRRAVPWERRSDGSETLGEPGPLNPTFGVVDLADVDPRTPARLVRNAARRFPVKPAGINYVIGGENVFTGKGQRWIAYFENGIYVEGDGRGRVIRKISG